MNLQEQKTQVIEEIEADTKEKQARRRKILKEFTAFELLVEISRRMELARKEKEQHERNQPMV